MSAGLSEKTVKNMPGAYRDAPAEELPNILIVDDRKENLRVTEKVLRHLPAKLFTANSGNEALSIMLRHKFAVVILDVQMPEMDGFETAALMQEEDSMRGTPIIFVTAISKEEKYASQAAEIGAVDYIFKPINTDILRSKVCVYLDLYMQREHILKLNSTLLQSNEELERFAYICAHDLKTPLRAIYAMSQWLEEDLNGTLDSNGQKYMSGIRKNALRMEKLLDDTLAYARIGNDKEKLGRNEIISGREMAEGIVGLLAPPPKFTVEIGENFKTLEIPRLPLQQIIHNLVDNALKHHDGATGRIRIDVEEADDRYTFTIRDDGPGIAPEFHEKIFEMYQTLRPRDQIEGSGMGLAIVKKVLMTYGGKIKVDSEPGKGATFIFTWPK